MVTRRDLMKMGLLSTGTFMTLPFGAMYGRLSAFFDDQFRSPYLKPFVDPLPTLEPLRPIARPADIAEYARPYVGPTTRFYEYATAERVVKFHRDLPSTPVWAYVDPNATTGHSPERLITFKFPRIELGQPAGGGILTRFHNDLTWAPRDFGYPTLTVHFHGGHQPAGADGFPHDIDNGAGGFPNPVTVKPGKHFDYIYPFRDVGFEDGPITRDERPSFYWFHDHILDFTGPNVYRGLANLAPAFDDLDTGNENTGLGLPSGDHDVALVFQDKIFDISGALIFDPFNGDGFLGDTMVVNGIVQPYHEVERRKYRIRCLNGSNARIYQMFLTNDAGQSYPMTQIATEGGLLAKPIPNLYNFELYLAQRVEIIVDFADPMFDAVAASGQPFVYIENRMRQDDGRKPDDVESQGPKLLQFRLSGPRVSTPPVPRYLRPFDPIPQEELDRAERRSFKFDRSGGVFTINGEPIDIDKKNVVPRNVPQIWHFENSSGGWWHPNHVHSEFMRVLRHNGQPPPLNERDGMARKDTVVMRKNETVDVYIKFRDFSGPFVAHCHNMEHEDHAMMLRFDIE
jgi:FtsP/CotA-like multicopper oxidase with cupredoxin domain